ncbi:ras-related protein Rap1-like [Branchiostoma lanceolatum]|uniref:ras-related protein Rap1-like n=1 Tax=Branchiostoma lanceolatum TaxID=7740 RepID=UPI003452E97F
MYTIVVLGSRGVGKSALITQYAENRFEEEYNPTIEDNFRKTDEIDGKSCLLDILDTGSQEEYKSLREGGLSRGQGFVLVFSLTQESSLTELVETRDRVLQARPGGEVPMVLVGNKCDLVSEREVSKGRGEGLSAKFNCSYLETSAMLGTDVHEVFRGLVRQIMKMTPGSHDYDPKRESRDQARGSRMCVLL